MAQADSAKKVARAAKAGGGPTRSQRNISWGYYASLAAVAVVGVVAIVGSSLGRPDNNVPPYFDDPQRKGELAAAIREAVSKHGQSSEQVKKAIAARDAYLSNTHWHMAYAIYDCTQKKGSEFLAPLNGNSDPDPRGIHAHDDGLIHIHPFVASASGDNAVMKEFFKATGLDVSRDRIEIPAKEASANGVPATKARTIKTDTKCSDGTTGIIRAVRFTSLTDTKGEDVTERFADIRLKSNQSIVFALAPKDREIPPPPSIKALEAPSDLVAADASAATGTADSTGSAESTAAGSAPAPSSTVVQIGSGGTVAVGAATTAPAKSAATTAPATPAPSTTKG